MYDINEMKKIKSLKVGDELFLDNDYSIIWEIYKIDKNEITFKNALYKYGYWSLYAATSIYQMTSIGETKIWEQKLIKRGYAVISQNNNSFIIQNINKCSKVDDAMKKIYKNIVLKHLPLADTNWAIYRCEFDKITGKFKRVVKEYQRYYNKQLDEVLNEFKNNFFWNCISVMIEALSKEEAEHITIDLFTQVPKYMELVVE